ncbi:MAG TPA: NAD-dependent DNA ligase LigA [Thermoanaerobaculia bacterium]|jgi:DNA ligase (NAD+)|nr:NAD-dependent DNA ligase LigA [Thermoanaerobaculia bacterium]
MSPKTGVKTGKSPKTNSPRERAEALSALIRRADHLYYVLDRPEVSDDEYDSWFRELKALEEAHPELLSPDSPTQRVGGTPVDSFPTVEHAAPMLSLESDNAEASLRRFDERVRKGLGTGVELRYVLEPKLDGLSIELVYEQGRLVRAATRGDGLKGEGVTENVRTIPAVPLRLRGEERAIPPFLAIRGEVIMRNAEFDKLNERLVAAGEEPFANPRNVAAGAIRQLDPRQTAAKPLDMYAYDVLSYGPGAAAPADVTSQRESLAALRQWGFRVNDRISEGADVETILAYHREIEGARDDLGYEIDGIVIKLDDLGERERLGFTARHPRWAFAYKFPPRKEITRILSIFPSVGRTGVVTPVAFLLPVEIGGVTVARATLHNREEVGRKDVREGDRVRIQRAGDVIPQVIERIEEPDRERSTPWQMPAACPSCGTGLIERGPFTVCPNSFECPAQLVGRIVHFASRNALDIEGLGDESAKLFVTQGLVRQLPDLFALTREQIAPLEGFAEKSATKLIEALHRARKTELARFLYGLGIPEVGTAVARDLARHFRTFERIRAASAEELQTVPGVGPRMAEQILAFFAEPQNAAVLDSLREVIELAAVTAPAPAAPSPLLGKKFVFTGGLETLSREQAKERIEQLGARAVSSVSKTTDYVVVGSDPGSKADDAARLGVAILDEAGFLGLVVEIESGSAPNT